MIRRAEIEFLQGRLRFLRNRIENSPVHLHESIKWEVVAVEKRLAELATEGSTEPPRPIAYEE